MTRKRDFLKPVSVLAALLLSSATQSKAADSEQPVINQKPSAETTSLKDKELLVLAPEDQVRSPNQHGSHASHGSHRSQMSSYK
jgi:hypothetical protein